MDLLQMIDNTNKNFRRNLRKILRFAQDTSFARFAPMTSYKAARNLFRPFTNPCTVIALLAHTGLEARFNKLIKEKV
jgi:hypothetical protein